MSSKIESGRRQIFFLLGKNYLVLSSAEFFSKILSAVAFAWLARILGPEMYGQLEFTIAIFFIFGLLVDSGLGFYGAKETARRPDQLNSLFLSITSNRFILALFSVILMNALALHPAIEQSTRNLIFLYSLALLLMPWLTQWVYQGSDRMVPVALASLIRWSVFFGGVVFFVKEAASLWLIPLIEGLAILASVLFMAGLLLPQLKRFSWKLDFRQQWSVWKKALPIGASELVWAIRVYFATLVMGLFIGGQQLGWFTASHRIVIALHAFVWLYLYNLLPSLARASEMPIGHVQNLLSISLRVSAWAGMFVTFMASAFALVIITFIFGEAFTSAASIFSLLLWILPLSLISGHYRYLLIGYGHQILEFATSLLGVLVTFFLSYVLIPRFGGSGAAWSLIVSEAVIWLAAYTLARWKIGQVPFLSEVWRPVLGGVLLAGIFYALPGYAWLGLTLASFAYGVFFVLSNRGLIAELRAVLPAAH